MPCRSAPARRRRARRAVARAAAGERQRDLEQPLLAVGERSGRHGTLRRRPKRGADRRSRRRSRCLPAGRAAIRAEPLPFGYALAQRLDRARSAKSWLIWKVRARPGRTRAFGARPVTSSPSSNTAPSVGLDTPVSRLISVVLPAPFGPIRAGARRARASTSVVGDARGRRSAWTGRAPRAWRWSALSRLRGHGAPRGAARTCSRRRAAIRRFDPLAPDHHQPDQQQADPDSRYFGVGPRSNRASRRRFAAPIRPP